jgi:hypothetical protein
MPGRRPSSDNLLKDHAMSRPPLPPFTDETATTAATGSRAYGNENWHFDQSTYLNAWLNQAGATAIDEVTFQPTLLTSDPPGALEQAKRAAVDLAKTHPRV